nr:MAG TPA: hypothetical protein [Caudoviricetes sp.]
MFSYYCFHIITVLHRIILYRKCNTIFRETNLK